VRRFAAIALVALVLSGCASHPIRVYSQAELAGELEAHLGYAREALLQQYPNAVLPHVKVVRFISGDEWSRVIPACLANSGWPVTISSDGWSSTSLDASEKGAFEVANYVCEAQYPLDPRYSIPLNRDQQAYLYAYYVQVLKPCLELHGYAPPGPAPTLAEFLNGYDQGSWDPYGVVNTYDWATVSAACPSEPAGLYGAS
jgi:hypothetical protein